MGANFFEFREQVTTKRGSAKPLAASHGGAGAGNASANTALTITQLTAQIERVVRQGFPASVLVKGEVSNYRPNASSGHVYFTMKDAGACVNCVMWKSDAARVKFAPADGMELLARGSVQVYAQQGRYQLYVTSLQPLGQGALELAFQQVRAKLEAEGLFAPERKRPIPKYPGRIVLVTSSQTAALQDMLKVLRRFPWVRLAVYHVPVQGDGCGRRIAEGIDHVSERLGKPGLADVVLLSRGGGSLEDLWGFNEEAVARAVANCSIPVVTGIGHEVDTSIADLVADYHAHTPTEAAQVVTAHWRGARDTVDSSGVRLSRGARVLLQQARQRLSGCERHEVFRRPLYRVHALRQHVDDRQRALTMAAGERIAALQRRVDALAAALQQTPPAVLVSRQRERLNGLDRSLADGATRRLQREKEMLARARRPAGRTSPARVRTVGEPAPRRARRPPPTRRRDGRPAGAAAGGRLARYLAAVAPEQVLSAGYSITTRKRDGKIVRNADELKAGERVVTRLAEGQFESVVDDGKQPRLFE
jgi:exodeoxyribonuclease VII large subunit